MNIAEYIIAHLKALECHHVFGIPGTSCADFFNAIDADSEMNYLVTTNELEAGYLADGYGRTGNIGAVSVSYGVGTLSLVNAVASAYTEHVPLIVINGGPSEKDLRQEREFGTLFSHSTGKDQTDLQVFQVITEYAAIVSSVKNAAAIIDKVFAVSRNEMRPVYIEIPQDMWKLELEVESVPEVTKVDENVPKEFIENALSEIKANENIVLFVGSEVQRQGLAKITLELIEKWNITFVTTALSKSILPESHPNFIGCYDSDLFHKDKFKVVDNADFFISLGCIWGIDHRSFIEKVYTKMVDVGYGMGRIGKNKFKNISTKRFIEEMCEEKMDISYHFEKPSPTNSKEAFGHDMVFGAVNDFIKNKTDIQIIIDTCLGSFAGADLDMPSTDMYLGNPVWLSIGQGSPASIGSYLANKKPPIIITGDGGFQIVSTTFSTMVKYNIPALILVLDNGLYAIEQYLIDGTYFENDEKPLPYVELNEWRYEAFPQVYNGGNGFRIKTALELKDVITKWDKHRQPTIVACEIPKKDLPTTN